MRSLTASDTRRTRFPKGRSHPGWYYKLQRSKLFVGAAIVAFSATAAQAKVEGDTIILGSAISLTGKYSTNGEHAENGYEFAVQKINDAGGVKVGAQLAERLAFLWRTCMPAMARWRSCTV